MEKNRFVPPLSINVYTWKFFFQTYHHVNPQLKINHTAVKKLWESINCEGKKKKLILNVEKSSLTCYEYLKQKLNEIAY